MVYTLIKYKLKKTLHQLIVNVYNQSKLSDDAMMYINIYNYFRQHPLLSIFPHKNTDFQNVMTNLQCNKVTYAILNGNQINREYEGLNVEKNAVGILDSNSGIMNANKCLYALKVCESEKLYEKIVY